MGLLPRVQRPHPALILAAGLRAAVLDLLYPPRCVHCGAWGEVLCPRCMQAAARAAGARCGRCWLPNPRPSGCLHCTHFSAIDGIRSGLVYAGAVRTAVHALKYRRLRSIAPLMTTAMLQDLSLPVRPDLVQPVPLHPRRERHRGFNQAALLAEGVAEHLGAEPVAGLRRVRPTSQQARTMSVAIRFKNVRGAFRWEGAPLNGAIVLLVDDVVTSGATLDACAQALKAAGAGRVFGLTYARAE